MFVIPGTLAPTPGTVTATSTGWRLSLRGDLLSPLVRLAFSQQGIVVGFCDHLHSSKMQIKLKNKKLESVPAENFACEGNIFAFYLHLSFIVRFLNICFRS